ncbi:hypothetical protein B0A49_09594, partial [Cryomyces minteri]
MPLFSPIQRALLLPPPSAVTLLRRPSPPLLPTTRHGQSTLPPRPGRPTLSFYAAQSRLSDFLPRLEPDAGVSETETMILKRADADNDGNTHRGMSGWGVFVIVVVVFLIFAAVGWVIFAHLRARRLGLPPPRLNPFSNRYGASRNYPSPAPSGPLAWLTS